MTELVECGQLPAVQLPSPLFAGDTMNAGTVPPTGGNAAHDNMQPFLAVSFIIATEGLYPTQN